MNREKLCPNSNFTAENNMGDLHKASHISTNFAHTTGFLIFGKALLILLPLSLQTLIMQISTQTDNHKYRKSVATKKVLIKKMGLKFQNSKLNTLCKIALIL